MNSAVSLKKFPPLLQVVLTITLSTKLKFKWVKDLYINPDTPKLIEEEVENSLEHIRTGNNFLNRTPIV